MHLKGEGRKVASRFYDFHSGLDTRPSPRNTRGYLFNIVFALAHTVCARESYSAFHTARTEGPVHRVSTQQDVFIRYVDLSRLASLNSSWPRTRSDPTFNPIAAPIFESSFHDIPLGRGCKNASVTNVIPLVRRLNEWLFLLYYTFFFLFAFLCNEQRCECNVRVGRLAARKFRPCSRKISGQTVAVIFET